MNLIIDIGNTVAKVAVFNLEGSIIDIQYYSNQSLGCICEICRKYPIEKGIVASVIDLTDEVVQKLKTFTFPLLMLDHTTPLPIKIGYKTPKTLGYDRVAAIVGAFTRFPNKNILVIDAGTAITYDFIDAEGCFYGGNISPGIKMRFSALHHFTGKLPLISAEGEITDLGQTTEDAIRAGVMRGIEFEMLGYVQEMQAKHADLLVFLTGGNDFSFDTKLKSSIFADRFLVIKGLNRILNYNKWDE